MGDRSGSVILTEEVVKTYEKMVPIAAEQVARLRRGDLAGFEVLLKEKERLIASVAVHVEERKPRSRDETREPAVGAAGSSRLVARAEEAIRSVLASEQEALAILLAARERVSGEMAELARGGEGLRSYDKAGTGARVLDRRG